MLAPEAGSLGLGGRVGGQAGEGPTEGEHDLVGGTGRLH